MDMKLGRIFSLFAMLIEVLVSALMMYVFFGVMNVEKGFNASVMISFHTVSYLALAGSLVFAAFQHKSETGFTIPIVLVSVGFYFLSSILDFAFITKDPKNVYILLHLILLLVYIIMTGPMMIMCMKHREDAEKGR